jgi:hypothetical protein
MNIMSMAAWSYWLSCFFLEDMFTWSEGLRLYSSGWSNASEKL